MAFLLLLPLVAISVPQDSVGSVAYERRATRQETLDAMRAVLLKETVRCGDWYLARPFEYSGIRRGDFAKPMPPESELARMAAGGEGADLHASYLGKSGARVEWERLGRVENRAVDLRRGEDSATNEYCSAYLYTTLIAEEEQRTRVTLGSDDGVRVWLNGSLIHEIEAHRSVDPESDALELDLRRGVNHLLVKVTQHEGGFGFQWNSTKALPAKLDAQLQYLLDRDFPPTREREHYSVVTLPVPDDLVLEVGGLDFFADGTPVVATRRGDVLALRDAYAVPPRELDCQVFASGLHEPLGAAVREENRREVVYTVQRAELTRLVDVDGDGRADRYESACDSWGISGNYHEFAFGPKFDSRGDAWVTLNVGFCGSLGKALVPQRGFALRISPDGTMTEVCDGLRSPNGIGFNTDGDAFYVDNQGDYVATCRLSQLTPGSWHGHPASLRWRDGMSESSDASRPPRADPVVWFPYKKMGQSAADVVLDDTRGKFGPFAGQLFVGDQMNCSVMRVALDKVDGRWQGACFPFLEGLDSGVNRIAFSPDGSMFVGQTDRGWGSMGRRSYGLQRVIHNGKTPFEVLAMRARSDGFDLEFTADVDPASVSDTSGYDVQSYTYEYHAEYGAPEGEKRDVAVTKASLIDPRTVRLSLAAMRAGAVHEFDFKGPRARDDGKGLLHTKAYYTLVRVPAAKQAMIAQDPVPAPAPTAVAKPRPKVLFLTHSAGFVHDVVRREASDRLSLAEAELTSLAATDFDVVATQDCARIEPQTLSQVAAVCFYTTGELPISAENRAALMDWIRHGGAFVGIHCASDTLYEYPPFLRMVGGAFDGHPWHQEIRVDVLDGAHPAVAQLERGFLINDEIYQFRNLEPLPLRMLLRVEPSSIDLSLGKRADGDYAIAWCREWGQGRVFYTSLGHRPEVWLDSRFRTHLLGGLKWAVEGAEWSPQAPSRAVLLTGFRMGMAAFEGRASAAAGWSSSETGEIEAVVGAGDIRSRGEFGDVEVHLEFQLPQSDATGEARGNSGVYLMGRYEVAVLDSFGVNSGKGDCAAIYGQRAPDVNACKPALAWQSFDIRLRAPRFADGKKQSNARISVWHNGILVQDDVELSGPTPGGLSDQESAMGPLLLQEHGSPVRFRNVWVRPY